MSVLETEVREHWAMIQPILTTQNDRDYDRALTTLNELLDEVGTDERHPLYGLLDTLGTLIAAYEAEHVPLPDADGAEALAYLMAEYGLR